MIIKLNRRNFLRAVCAGAASQAMPKLLYCAEGPAEKQKSKATILKHRAKDTLTAVELDCGESLEFRLFNGQIRKLTLLETSAEKLLEGHKSTLYHFTSLVEIDGHEMVMERYVGCQESFYEPYVINGMRIWFDAVADIFNFLQETHGKCKPAKDARFAVVDATIPICPEEILSWCPTARDFIDIKDCFNGDDCWLGAFDGIEAHGGLDINHARGTEIYTPIAVDEQYLYKRLATGDANNGWCGIRRWPNGDTWKISVSHILRLLQPEHQPIPAGVHIAEGAGVWFWSHNHSHFMFSVIGEDGLEINLDPWIIFRQIFENNKERKGSIKSSMSFLGPQKTSEPVALSSGGSRKSPQADKLRYYWTFGDGGFSVEPNPRHVYSTRGLYPVTLTVDDGTYRDSFTQHITVDGPVVTKQSLALTAREEFTFRRRPIHMMDTYGIAPSVTPHTLYFTARPSRPFPEPKRVQLVNSADGTLPKARISKIDFEGQSGWLGTELSGSGNEQSLEVAVDASGLKPAEYSATVEVWCPGAINDRQSLRVALNVPDYKPPPVVTIDDSYIGFYATPYFWVGHRFHRWPCNDYNCFCLVNGRRAAIGEFARFTPDLSAGTYEVFFPEISFSWNQGEISFAVRVKHAKGINTIWMKPKQSETIDMWEHTTPNPTKLIGTFEFNEGSDGYVEILAEGSRGQVSADAVIFKKVS